MNCFLLFWWTRGYGYARFSMGPRLNSLICGFISSVNDVMVLSPVTQSSLLCIAGCCAFSDIVAYQPFSFYGTNKIMECPFLECEGN